MHAYNRAQKSAEKVRDLLALAAAEAQEGLEASRKSGIVSPTPAEHELLLGAVRVAHGQAQSVIHGSTFVPEHLHR